MYYKIYKKAWLISGDPYDMTNGSAAFEGEQMLFYTPNLYRALVARDKLLQFGHKEVYIKHFTIDEQAKWIMKKSEYENKNTSLEAIKFYLENSDIE